MRRVLISAFFLTPATALAVPGPDSVAVVANADVPESVALARTYAAARDIPDVQVCLLSLPQTADISLDDFRNQLLNPTRECLDEVLPRIEAILLIRGVPLRVRIPDGAGSRAVSVAAALGIWDSALADGTPLLGQPPGLATMCGNQACYSATWRNPFTEGVFEPGWTRDLQGVTYRPMLVTMLHARTYADAARLIASATTAESLGRVDGTWMLMEGRDPARSALDGSFDRVIMGLRDTRVTDVERVAFDSDLTGRTLGAFIVGTAQLGTTIEGNRFSPGALVDNLTSFGAVPQNFEEMGESQVSIARWVNKGVAGVHGTTAEPLSNSFPSREFLVDYANGMTLAEAYLRQMPFTYWQNLVLGDPMTAPYAIRPQVQLQGLADGDVVAGAQPVVVTAADGEGRPVASLRLFVDGQQVAESEGEPIDECLVFPEGDVHILAVAQIGGVPTAFEGYTPKGWTSIRIQASAGRRDCTSTPDAGVIVDTAAPDASSVDATTLDAGQVAANPGDPEGCSCAAAPRPKGSIGWLICGAVLFLVGFRSRFATPVR